MRAIGRGGGVKGVAVYVKKTWPNQGGLAVWKRNRKKHLVPRVA